MLQTPATALKKKKGFASKVAYFCNFLKLLVSEMCLLLDNQNMKN